MPNRRFPLASRAGDVLADRLEGVADRLARSRVAPLGRFIRNATEAWNQTGGSMVEGVPPLNVPPANRHGDAPDKEAVAAAWVRWAKGDADPLLDLLHPEVHDHVSGRTGKDIWRVVQGWITGSMGDIEVDLHSVAADGDRVLIWITTHGTHIGSLFPWMQGRPATGRRVSHPQLHVVRVVDGLITEHWAVRDDLRVLEAIDAP